MNRGKKLGLYLASALIPCALFLLVFFLLDLAPFGDSTMLVSDSNGQYLDFIAYWKTVLTGENDIFYTFSKTMGGNGYNLAAYYVLSPFNLLFLFSSVESLPLFYTLVFFLKLAACGLTFFTLSCRLYGCTGKNLIFSACYALMAYVVYFAYHLMWLDGVLILPLVLLGLWNLSEKQPPILYIASLGYALATNFYIGYMLCIASVLFFAAILVLQNSTLKRKGQLTLRFIFSSAAAGFGTAVIWLPTVFSLLAERSKTNPITFSLSRELGFTNLISGFACGVVNEASASNILPLVFCASIILIFVFLYFLNRKIPLKQKIVSGLLILFFLFSFFFTLPNMVWHGFSPANSFNYRYSFIFSFLLILIAQHQFHSRSGDGIPVVLFAAAAISGALMYTTVDSVGVTVTLVSIAMAALCILLLKRKPRLYAVSLFLIAVIELTANCGLCWNNLITVSEPLDQSEFSQSVQKTQPALDYLAARDPDFYRIEKTYFRTRNDSSLFDYAGLSHFSSTELVKTKVFMRSMGFSSHYNFWSAYLNGSTAEAESFLGVKYLLSDGAVPAEKEYEPIATVEDITIYRNPFALPLCILAEEEIRALSPESANPFDLHNRIWQSITARNQCIFTEAPYRVSSQNLSVSQNPDGSITYKKLAPETPAFVRYTVSSCLELPLYYYFTAPDSVLFPNAPEDQDVTVFINGEENGRYFHYLSWNMSCAGIYKPGETVFIDLVPNQDEFTVSGAWFCHEDLSVLREFAAGVQQQDLSYELTGSSRITGTLTAQSGQVLLLTVPQESGWHLKIDGEETNTYAVLDALLAADIPAGNHAFELYFIPPGFYAGLLLTILTVLACLSCLILSKKIRRKNK